MKVMKKIMFVSAAMLLNSCSMQQNPLANAPESIKYGIPPTQNAQVPEKPVSKEALQIDAPTLVNGHVDTQIEISIQGRVLIPAVAFTLKIKNLVQFPGATFDAAAGVFKWTPSKEILGNVSSGQFELIAELVTIQGASNFPVSIERKSITLNIFKDFAKPIINSVLPAANYLMDYTYWIPIEFEDSDYSNSTDFSLLFKDCSNSYYTNLSSVVSYKDSDFSKDPLTNKIKGNIFLDLRKLAIPYNTVNFCFSVINYSKYGIASDPYQVEFFVKHTLANPVVTQSSVNIKQGTVAEFSFSFFDPMQIGNVLISNIPDLAKLPKSTLKCDGNYSGNKIVNCKLLVDATTLGLGRYDLTFKVQNSYYPQDTVETNLTVSVNVKDIL
ncbi:MAG: hypothetical protein WA160_05605 [Pseudobdellovibrio sp.]